MGKKHSNYDIAGNKLFGRCVAQGQCVCGRCLDYPVNQKDNVTVKKSDGTVTKITALASHPDEDTNQSNNQFLFSDKTAPEKPMTLPKSAEQSLKVSVENARMEQAVRTTILTSQLTPPRRKRSPEAIAKYSETMRKKREAKEHSDKKKMCIRCGDIGHWDTMCPFTDDEVAEKQFNKASEYRDRKGGVEYRSDENGKEQAVVVPPRSEVGRVLDITKETFLDVTTTDDPKADEANGANVRKSYAAVANEPERRAVAKTPSDPLPKPADVPENRPSDNPTVSGAADQYTNPPGARHIVTVTFINVPFGELPSLLQNISKYDPVVTVKPERT